LVTVVTVHRLKQLPQRSGKAFCFVVCPLKTIHAGQRLIHRGLILFPADCLYKLIAPAHAEKTNGRFCQRNLRGNEHHRLKIDLDLSWCDEHHFHSRMPRLDVFGLQQHDPADSTMIDVRLAVSRRSQVSNR
jgi:hypothetical protein